MESMTELVNITIKLDASIISKYGRVFKPKLNK